jgi:hypothetical protein
MSWKSIESAPRNGTPVLLLEQCDPEDYVASIVVGAYDDIGVFEDIGEKGWINPLAPQRRNFEGHYVWTVIEPTDWMHCPPPPLRVFDMGWLLQRFRAALSWKY